MNKLLMIAALVAAPAFADPGYAYLDVSYQFGGDISASGSSIDSDGYIIKASFEINDSTFVEFDYSSIGTDPSALDITDYALMVGWHNELAFAKVGYESGEFDVCAVFVPPCTIDDSGFTFDAGLRSMVSDTVELNAHVGYSDLGDLDTYTNFGFGAIVQFSESAGVSFNYDLRSGDGFDITSMGLGLRFSF